MIVDAVAIQLQKYQKKMVLTGFFPYFFAK